MKIFLFIKFILLSPNFIFCQDLPSDNPNDSVSDNYYSYTLSKFSIGLQSQFKPLVINSRLTFSLSYAISNFYHPLRESKNQIGLFNEIGANNMSVYIQIGPELRLHGNIYIVPKIGVSFAWIAGVERGRIGFLYFYGGNIGYIYSLKENLSFYFEGGADFIPIEETQGIYFGRIGVSFKMF
jgi:hypothetical protein